MGKKIVSIVTMFISCTAIMMLVTFIALDQNIEASTNAVKELADKVQYNGFITERQYKIAVGKLGFNSANLDVTVITDKNGANLIELPYENIKEISDKGFKLFKEGDDVQFDLVLTEPTPLDVIIGSLLNRQTKRSKVICTRNAIVTTTKYSEDELTQYVKSS